MSNAAEVAAALRAQADAVESEGVLEEGLAAAKAAYRADPGDEKAKARARAAGAALAAARQLRRGEVVAVGGDAVRTGD